MLGRLPGVIKVKADHKTQLVSLTLDTDELPLDDVKQQLELAGFLTG